jgi:drug/metabolite transporter (DMT)-like permease
MILAVVLALASATCYASTSALQQRAARQVRPRPALDPRILLALLRRPLWLSGWVPDLAGTGLQALALRFGPIALVQPLLVTGMFLAIPLEAALDRRRPRRRDLLTVAVSAVGLAAFLTAAQPEPGVADPTRRAWIDVALGCAVVVSVCTIAARFFAPAPRGTLLGIATGVLYGLTAALLKPSATTLTTHPLALLTDWHLYALILAGLAGLVLNQDAFQSGPLAAPLTALTLADPVVSIIIAVTAFHERLSTDAPRLAVEIAATLVMAAGIWLASTIHPAGR